MGSVAILDHLALIAEAPFGIDALRASILRRAVTGRLNTRGPGDNSAAVYAERAQLELNGRSDRRGRQASSKKMAGDAALSIGPPEASTLPVGWQVVSLSHVAALESGHTPDRNVPAYWTGDIPWIGIKDARAHRDGTVWSTNQHVSQAGIENSSTRLLPTETVCLSRTASVGYAVIMGRPMCTSQDFVNFICTSALLPRYLQLIFMAEKAALRRFAKGAVHQTIYFPEVKAFHVLLPPVPEQARIVAKVDELTRLCDELEERQRDRREAGKRFRSSALYALTQSVDSENLKGAWDRLAANWFAVVNEPASAQELRRSVLRLAIRGNLSERSDDDASAASFIERVKERRGSASRPLPSGERPPLPSGWIWASLGEVAINRDADRIPLRRADRETRQGQYPYYGASGVIDALDDYIFDGTYLLIGEDGANLVSRSTPVAFLAQGQFWVNNHAHVLESIDVQALEYLSLFINSTDLRPYLTGIAQPKLNQARMNAIPVPVPPLAEQRRIVRAVKQILGSVDALERSLTNRVLRQETLSAALTRFG